MKIFLKFLLFLAAIPAFAAPVITNVLVTGTTATTATIQWTTASPATSQLAYGTDSSLPFLNNENFTPVTSHTMTLTLLTVGPLYYVAPISTDGGGSTQANAITFSLCGSPLTPVQGSINNYYQYGSYTLTWVPPSGAPSGPTVCGKPISSPVSGQLDGGSSFNTQVADASKVVPGPGQWEVQATDAGNLSPLTVFAYLSSSSQNVSAQLQAAAATGGLSACIINVNSSQLYPSGCGGSGPGGGVTKINNVAGAFTFTGPGQSCTSTTCNFPGLGSTLTANAIPKASSATGLVNSLLTDNGTTLNYSGTGVTLPALTIGTSPSQLVLGITSSLGTITLTGSGFTTTLNAEGLSTNGNITAGNLLISGTGTFGTLANGTPGSPITVTQSGGGPITLQINGGTYLNGAVEASGGYGVTGQFLGSAGPGSPVAWGYLPIQVNGSPLLSPGATINFVSGTNATISNPSAGNINISVSSGGTTTLCSGTITLSGTVNSANQGVVGTATCTSLASTDTVIATTNTNFFNIVGFAPATTGGLSLSVVPSTNTITVNAKNDTSAPLTIGASAVLNYRVVR